MSFHKNKTWCGSRSDDVPKLAREGYPSKAYEKFVKAIRKDPGCWDAVIKLAGFARKEGAR